MPAWIEVAVFWGDYPLSIDFVPAIQDLPTGRLHPIRGAPPGDLLWPSEGLLLTTPEGCAVRSGPLTYRLRLLADWVARPTPRVPGIPASWLLALLLVALFLGAAAWAPPASPGASWDPRPEPVTQAGPPPIPRLAWARAPLWATAIGVDMWSEGFFLTDKTRGTAGPPPDCSDAHLPPCPRTRNVLTVAQARRQEEPTRIVVEGVLGLTDDGASILLPWTPDMRARSARPPSLVSRPPPRGTGYLVLMGPTRCAESAKGKRVQVEGQSWPHSDLTDSTLFLERVCAVGP